jgi:hypothetical protein
LVTHWRFDETEDAVAYDSGDAGHDGRLVGARRIAGASAGAIWFSGHDDFVRVGDLPGDFAAVSIAFWVKPDSLPNRWNAILFCDDWSEHDLHLSLLTSGAANVALHLGSAGAAHYSSFGEVGGTDWHHVAVVCDTREGGSIQFFLDGRPDRRHLFYGPESIVRLTGVRLGGYNVWEKQAGANFHGALDDFRIYRGMLTEQQVRDLADGRTAIVED